ncbi:MAG: hypothetical protein QOE44_1590 [Solirubrobacteraceae bacterium]|nr:hypothetical protein [Solirubrobacteraceae bacterium]
MTLTKRVAPFVVAAAVAAGGLGAPALGATSTAHWTGK